MRLQHPLRQRPLVLVIESDPRLQRLVARAVEDEGCSPVVAASEADGYGVLATYHDDIALVVLDVTARGIDGFGFRRLQLDAPRMAAIPTVTLSARALSPDERAYLHPFATLATAFRLQDMREVVSACAHTMVDV